MHQALLIPEILHDVCTYAADDTLLSLSQSCKAFHETAIQALWSELFDLNPLIKCFPEDAWTIDRGYLEIMRCLAPDDWTNFLKYSSYVRHLGNRQRAPASTMYPYPRLGGGAVSSLSIYRPVLILFPRLVELSWMDHTLRKNDYDLPGILGLIGPHLKRISITDWSLQDDEEQHLQTSLSLISNRFPSLQYFYLHCKQPLAVCKLISRALPSNLDDLRTFQCDHVPIAESAFSALGRLRRLSKLFIRLPAFLSWAPLPPDSFPAVRQIGVTALTRDYLALNLDTVHFPQVKEATIHLRDVPKVHDAVRFFDLISRQFSHAVLSELSIYMSEDANLISRSRDNKVTLTRDHLRHLLSFTKLTVLMVNLACPYALDSNFYSEIAKALPHIECLYMGTYDYCHHDTAPGMLPTMTQVLAPFAIHCPKLRVLGIPFDARQTLTIDAVRDALPQRPSRSAVHRLDCSHCPIKDARFVAAYLARVFPMLEGHSIEWTDFDTPHPLATRWRQWERIWTEVRQKLCRSR